MIVEGAVIFKRTREPQNASSFLDEQNKPVSHLLLGGLAPKRLILYPKPRQLMANWESCFLQPCWKTWNYKIGPSPKKKNIRLVNLGDVFYTVFLYGSITTKKIDGCSCFSLSLRWTYISLAVDPMQHWQSCLRCLTFLERGTAWSLATQQPWKRWGFFVSPSVRPKDDVFETKFHWNIRIWANISTDINNSANWSIKIWENISSSINMCNPKTTAFRNR